MEFGGKVFIIGVGKNEQVVCFSNTIPEESVKLLPSVPVHAHERK